MNVRETTELPFLIEKWMQFWRYYGLATPWGVIYYIDEVSSNDQSLRRHEKTHIRQMERDGIFKYMVMYNYYWIVKGYKNNPYEMEARKAERDIIPKDITPYDMKKEEEAWQYLEEKIGKGETNG